jgi:hypothetical protein
VFKAELSTGRELEVKQSRATRAPLRVKCTFLRHEPCHITYILEGCLGETTRTLRLLLHLGFLAIEKLGPSLRDGWPGSSVYNPVDTALPNEQCVDSPHKANTYESTIFFSCACTQHGLIHCDIKPLSFICTLDDPSI